MATITAEAEFLAHILKNGDYEFIYNHTISYNNYLFAMTLDKLRIEISTKFQKEYTGEKTIFTCYYVSFHVLIFYFNYLYCYNIFTVFLKLLGS